MPQIPDREPILIDHQPKEGYPRSTGPHSVKLAEMLDREVKEGCTREVTVEEGEVVNRLYDPPDQD